MNGGGGYQIIGLAIAAGIAAFVYTDAKKRGMNAVGWAIGTFLLCIVILPLYLIMRKPVGGAGATGMPPQPPQPMPLPPTYGSTQQTTFTPPATFTPPPAQGPTGTPGGKFCPQCGQPHDGTAKFCPNCGAAF